MTEIATLARVQRPIVTTWQRRDEFGFFEDIRVWMAKSDADDRKARGEPVPADVEMYFRRLTTGAVEALRRLVEQEMRKVTRHNVVRQQSPTGWLTCWPATPTRTCLRPG